MGLGSFFSGLLKKKTPAAAQQQAAPAEDTRKKPAELSPQYGSLYMAYTRIMNKNEEIIDNKYTHANTRSFLNEREQEKKRNDVRMEELNKTETGAGTTEEVTQYERSKDLAQHVKEAADQNFQNAQSKLDKNIGKREALEKHRGTKLVQIVKHADEVQQAKDDRSQSPSQTGNQSTTQNQGTGQGTSQNPGTGQTGNQGTAQNPGAGQVQNTGTGQNAGQGSGTGSKAGQKVKKGAKWFFAKFLETASGFASSIGGAISDGFGIMKDMGEDAQGSTKTLYDAMKTGGEEAKKAQKNALGDSVKAEASPIAGTIGASFSVIASIYSVVDFGKSLVSCIKKSAAGHTDSQERWLQARQILGKIASCISNFIGASANFIGMVPFLGSILGIVDSGFQMVVGCMNLATNSVHVQMMRNDKKKIWSEIMRKKEKYKGTTDAGLYNITSDSFSKVDTKRKEMMEKVVKSNENKGLEIEGVKEEKMERVREQDKKSRNDSEFRNANQGLSTRISSLRQAYHEGRVKTEDKEKYKTKMHQMEALELMSRYRTVVKSHKKMAKSVGHDVEGMLTNGTKLAGNITKLAGELLAPTGFGAMGIAAGAMINTIEGGYELVRFGGSKAYKAFRTRIGSEANKENTRNEMGEFLYNEMLSISEHKGIGKWAGDFFDTSANAPDYLIRQESDTMEHLYSITRRGLDMPISDLFEAKSPSKMKDVLASAFSQEGTSSMAEDGI